ncbi:glutamate ABC transporter substrate-binding protein [Allokutzneria sp. A3M-2-11 16]|uniref:glutamate ABC transporter substrate-binding protein n=1 Tax=Allokutzneria sp. A3M-2-11 16 TaxID=2962043 RepID=UPI0020B8DB0C|nr:glutamate ABC transporter substrate-binding protein [Allokutzneria sp. A3M-2-11 16]MCP3801715.1 glutamate ABC transporter substrate-binding protein [Allokutzneria sp. A3M-2-11 16]
MRFSKGLRIGAAAAALAVLAACGGGSGGGSGLEARAKSGKLVVGIKFDQPGMGLKTPTGYTGFDVDVAKYIAKELGLDESKIEWKEAPSAQRENLLEKGDVDMVTATYSITEDRKKKVLFAGPYLTPGQDLLVRANDTSINSPENLNGKKLCSVKGSTSAAKVNEKFGTQAGLQEYGGYSECLTGLESGAIDAISTDDSILAGYAAANPGKFRLIGKPFTKELIGVGLAKSDTKGRDAVNKALEKMMTSGAWKAALEKNLDKSGYKIPEPPQITEK